MRNDYTYNKLIYCQISFKCSPMLFEIWAIVMYLFDGDPYGHCATDIFFNCILPIYCNYILPNIKWILMTI